MGLAGRSFRRGCSTARRVRGLACCSPSPWSAWRTYRRCRVFWRQRGVCPPRRHSRRAWALHTLASTGIEESTMPTGRASPLPTLPGTRQRPATTARPRQIDLFAEDTGKTAPTWRELPEEARVLLTNLMARLILDHARVDGAASSKEVNDDL